MRKINQRKFFYRNRRKSIFKKKWFWYVILFVGSFIFLFYFLSFSQAFSLKVVKVQGNLTISSESIEILVFENYKDFLPIFNSKSIIFADKNFLVNIIKERFLRVAEVKIIRRLPHTIELQIVEREPKAIFCHQEACYLIDQEGVTFKEVLPPQSGLMFEISEFNSPHKRLPQFEDISLTNKILLGQRVLSQMDVKKLLAISEGLLAVLGLEPIKIIKVDSKRADVLLSQGWKIFFNLEDQISYQINNLKLLLEKQISQDEIKRLEYIDLRFGSRVYYKFKENLPEKQKSSP